MPNYFEMRLETVRNVFFDDRHNENPAARTKVRIEVKIDDPTDFVACVYRGSIRTPHNLGAPSLDELLAHFPGAIWTPDAVDPGLAASEGYQWVGELS